MCANKIDDAEYAARKALKTIRSQKSPNDRLLRLSALALATAFDLESNYVRPFVH